MTRSRRRKRPSSPSIPEHGDPDRALDLAYGEAAARRYDLIQSRPMGFAARMAPWVIAVYRTVRRPDHDPRVLDVGCGTGQLAVRLASDGIPVVGLDLATEMLRWARENAATSSLGELIDLREADVTNFRLDRPVGMAVCLYNVINHLPSPDHVRRCLDRVRAVLRPGAPFVFDIDTRLGFEWSAAAPALVERDGDTTVWDRRFVGDDQFRSYGRGWFLDDHHWRPYEETVDKIVISCESIQRWAADAGFHLRFTDRKLTETRTDPEADVRAYCVAIAT